MIENFKIVILTYFYGKDLNPLTSEFMLFCIVLMLLLDFRN